jgi:hypothetical protein
MKTDYRTTLDATVLRSIRRLVDYAEPLERQDYEMTPEGEQAGHIYRHIKAIRDWLNPP